MHNIVWLIFLFIARVAHADLPKCHLTDGSQRPPSIETKSLANQTLTTWAQKLPADVTEIELVTRLVYAETLATNCVQTVSPAELSRGIAWVVRNRSDLAQTHASKARRYGRGLQGVVFHPSQFNSSLSTKYSLSQWLEFLCPSQKTLWSVVENEVRAALADNAKNPFVPVESGHLVTQVYYYKHFDARPKEKRPAPPTWAQPESKHRIRLKPSDPEFDACIGFFREDVRAATGNPAAQFSK